MKGNDIETKTLKKTICLLGVLLSIAVVCFFGAAAFAFADDSDGEAAQDQQTVVRVGYLESAGYEEVDEAGHRSGWGYEWLQSLAYHTGWKYEYVSGTFSELMDKLQAGEIDLMANISYTDERAETLLFSTNPQGREKYYLWAKPDNGVLDNGDVDSLQGKRVGAVPGLQHTVVGQQWLADRGIQVSYSYYDTDRELFDALDTGKVDAVLMNDSVSSASASPVVCVGASDYYFATPKSRADLMEQINSALVDIQSVNPRYSDEVKTRYAESGGSQYLSSREKAWLEQHGNVVKFGYLDRSLPYSTEADDGSLSGSLATLVDKLESTFGVTVETYSYPFASDLVQALQDGSVDAVAPLSSNFWLAEENGMAQSDVFATTSALLLYSGDSVDSCLDVVACDRSSVLHIDSFQQENPDSQVLRFDSLKECLQAIRSGSVHGIAIPATEYDSFRDVYDFDGLKTAELPMNVDLDVCVQRGNSELLNIINKGIANSQEAMDVSALSHRTYADDELPLIKFLRRNITTILAVVVGVLACLAFLLLYSLRRARRAEAEANAASEAKSQFLARMSHDIRTPLNGIIGLMEVGDLDPDDRTRAAEIREKTKVTADHLLSLLSDVLEMSKLQSGDIVVERVPFNLMEVFQKVYAVSEMRATGAGVTIKHGGTGDLPYLNVVGSPVLLERVFINLLSNAIKYNKPGGVVNCTARCISNDGGSVVYGFRFEDNGIGMSEEYLEHIFEPFSQAGDTARSTYQGTGLGMSIVKSIVDKMDGTLSIESELGVGSVFEVTFPFLVDKNTESGPDANAVGECSISGMRLLLAEDNELNREIECALLEAEGATVACAVNGEEALKLFECEPEGSFDAILMDVMMPVMDGYKAARAIRTSGKGDAGSIPIIATTANAFSEDAQKALEAGMDAHIPKPIDMGQLKEALAKLRN